MVMFEEHARKTQSSVENVDVSVAPTERGTKVAFLRVGRQRAIPRMRDGSLEHVDFESAGQPQFAPASDWRPGYTAISVTIDAAAALAATALAVLVRFGGAVPGAYILGSLALPLLWVALVAMNRAYEHRFIGVGTEEFRRVLRAGVTLMAVVACASFATKAEVARGYVIIALPGAVLLSLLSRCAQRAWLHQQRLHGHCVQRTLLVGSGDTVRLNAHRLRADSSHGMVVVGACVTDGISGEVDFGVPVVGGISEIEGAVRKTKADTVTVLSSALLSGADLRRLAWRLESLGADLVVCSGLTEITGGRITIRPTAHSPLLQVARARLSGPSRLVKGILDRGAALLGLIFLAPIFAVIGVWIWSKDGSAPLFRQQRVGRNGREFTLYKFRTMVSDAERLKAELLDHNESDQVLFKMAQDPRVTTVGRRLRRYSVVVRADMIYVVRGEMSLVGPRPPLPQEVSAYGHDMRRRLLVKPGLTGLWQVSGRSDLSWSETEILDIRYVENWSLGLDVVILCRTARAIIHGNGAY